MDHTLVRADHVLEGRRGRGRRAAQPMVRDPSHRVSLVVWHGHPARLRGRRAGDHRHEGLDTCSATSTSCVSLAPLGGRATGAPRSLRPSGQASHSPVW
jgi:hypothetical protein